MRSFFIKKRLRSRANSHCRRPQTAKFPFCRSISAGVGEFLTVKRSKRGTSQLVGAVRTQSVLPMNPITLGSIPSPGVRPCYTKRYFFNSLKGAVKNSFFTAPLCYSVSSSNENSLSSSKSRNSATVMLKATEIL